MNPAAQKLSGRKYHSIHRPVLEDAERITGEVPLYNPGTERFRLSPQDGILEGKFDEDWKKVNFTGRLRWYVGGGFSLIGTFEDGVLTDVREADL